MGNNERLSRRGFLKLGGIATGVFIRDKTIGDAGGYEVAKKKDASYKETELANNIIVSQDDDYRLTIKNGREVVPRVKKRAFAKAILFVAREKDPKGGERKVRSFLEESPLVIRLSKDRDDIARPFNTEQKYYAPATYTPQFPLASPVITFNPGFIRNYYQVRNEDDYLNWAKSDHVVYEEIFHFWQNANESMIGFLMKTGIYNVEEISALAGLNRSFEKFENTVEGEAKEEVFNLMASQVVRIQMQEGTPEEILEPFFTFEEVRKEKNLGGE